MRYKIFLKKIMEQLTGYKEAVDTLASSYLAEKQKLEEELMGTENKYTSQFIEEARRNWKPSKDYSGEISKVREKHQKVTLAYLDQIQKELDSYFQVPVNPSFASTVTALKAVGAKINNREFQLLQGASGSYWDRKLLSELAISRTEKTDKVELSDKNEPERTTVDKPIPYFGVELPDIENVYESLQNVKNAVSMAFSGYCGANYELKDVVFPISEYTKQTNTRITEEYGIQTREQTLDSVQISKMAGSLKCFDENHRPYTEFSEIMDGIEATMPKPERKTELTDSDRNLIDTLISPNYPSLAKDEAVKIAKADSRLGEILALDPRYGAGVRKALEGVCDDE